MPANTNDKTRTHLDELQVSLNLVHVMFEIQDNFWISQVLFHYSMEVRDVCPFILLYISISSQNDMYIIKILQFSLQPFQGIFFY